MKTMKEKKNGLLKTIVLGGMMAGALPLAANANDLLSYGDLGSGAEIRSNLLDKYGSPVNTSNLPTDFVVGEGKCGEGKCGEKKKETKSKTKKTEAKTTEGKCGEGKCGEGKCGEGKCGSKKKEAKKTEKKSTEGKCGEGKCGGK